MRRAPSPGQDAHGNHPYLPILARGVGASNIQTSPSGQVRANPRRPGLSPPAESGLRYVNSPNAVRLRGQYPLTREFLGSRRGGDGRVAYVTATDTEALLLL